MSISTYILEHVIDILKVTTLHASAIEILAKK